jgi:hypothetical protein
VQNLRSILEEFVAFQTPHHCHLPECSRHPRHENDENTQEDGSQVDEEPTRYFHTIRSTVQYGLISDWFGQRANFRQVEAHICSLRQWLPGIKEDFDAVCSGEASAKIRLHEQDGLQSLREVLSSCYAYSLAVDASCSIHGLACFSLRVRTPPRNVNEDVSNLHVLAIPMVHNHTGLYMFNLAQVAIYALDDHWRHKLVGVAALDGVANVMGVTCGWQSRLQMFVAVVSYDAFYRIWCVNYQIAVLHKAAVLAKDASVPEKPWMDQLHGTVKYLRKQSTFSDEIGSK